MEKYFVLVFDVSNYWRLCFDSATTFSFEIMLHSHFQMSFEIIMLIILYIIFAPHLLSVNGFYIYIL